MRQFPFLTMNNAIAFTLPIALILGSVAAQAEDKTKTTTPTPTTSTGSGQSGIGSQRSGAGAGKVTFNPFVATKGTNPKGPSGQAAGQSSAQGSHASGGHK
jgi:hypothetical protein